MRTIKFRAWDKKNNCWANIEEWSISGPNATITNKQHGREIPDLVLTSDDFYEWMQYTGLKDKNGEGQEMYEGDIVKCVDKRERERILTIKYIPSRAGFYYTDATCAEGEWIDWLGVYESEEVIGNIYSNPELIK